MVGDVLLDLVPSTGDVCLLHNYFVTTDLGLSSCYMSRQLNEESKLLTLTDVAGSCPASAET